MKKVILSAMAVFALTFTNAQENESSYGFGEGDVFASGALTFSNVKHGDDKTSVFTFAPKAGYFFTENIAAGLGLGYSNSKVETAFGETKVNTIGFDVFGRYYFTPANQFSLFGELNIGYDTADFDAYKVNTFGVDLGLGMNYWISNSFALEAGLGLIGYSSEKADTSGAEAENTFTFGGDLRGGITFGVIYKF